jgi:hypothetical protein
VQRIRLVSGGNRRVRAQPEDIFSDSRETECTLTRMLL